MATKQESSRVTRADHDSDNTENEEDYSTEEEEDDEEGADVAEEKLSLTDPKNMTVTCSRRRFGSGFWMLGRVSKWNKKWNRVILLVCAMSLFVDPFYLYTLSMSETCLCVFVDGWLAITVTVIRTMTDLLYLWNMRFLVRMTNPGPHAGARGTHGYKPSNVKSKKDVLFNLFVLLPLPQVMMWLVVPYLLKRGLLIWVMDVLLLTFGIHFIPKLYHSFCHLRNINRNSDNLFDTMTGTFLLNMIIYFILSNAAGACWYLLGLQRSSRCLIEQCTNMKGCKMKFLKCKDPIYYGTTSTIDMIREKMRLAWTKNNKARSTCLGKSPKFNYGSYAWTVNLVTNESRLERILLPIFWGLMNLTTFGNLEGSTNSHDWVEIVFNISILGCSLVLVALLIGNIETFASAPTLNKQEMQINMRNLEWWMKKRNLPKGFKKRIRDYEQQKWIAMRGADEYEMVRDLPEGLRKDVKYYLCLDLVRQVPLFQHMDDLVLENICERLKSHIFPKGEIIQEEGDPVQRMLFVVRGHIQSSQSIRDGLKSYCMLGPGNFSGDELLSWCLRRPFLEKLPFSATTLITLDTMEAFGLEADDIKYVTQHFRYTFVSEKVKRSARYYSPGWRTWGAVIIQLAWRRYMDRLRLKPLLSLRPRRCSSFTENNIKLYTAMLTSPKPNPNHFNP